jgi:hypothetical protein
MECERAGFEQCNMPPVTTFADDLGSSTVQPYAVADTAFRLSAHCMKCFDKPETLAANHFNARVISTRSSVYDSIRIKSVSCMHWFDDVAY